jgi:hypothetical protein
MLTCYDRNVVGSVSFKSFSNTCSHPLGEGSELEAIANPKLNDVQP